MCDIFIMCFVLFVFVTCCGWNFNAIAATAASGYDTTFGHVTDVISGHVTSGDVTSGSTPFQNYDGLQVLMY